MHDATTFAPVDLDGVPEVDALLTRLGPGPFRRAEVSALPGRNDVWAGRTVRNRHVLVKRIGGDADDAPGRLGRSLAFERFASGLTGDPLRRPGFLGADERAGLVVHRLLPDAHSGATLADDGTFGDDMARAAGTLVGTLHSGSPRSAVPETVAPWPSAGPLVGISQRRFDEASGGELEAWRLLQGDTDLIAAVTDLAAGESQRPCVPAHCDLRLDQFLLSGGVLHLADWEEFRRADPARDVGAFAGEWLHRAVLDVVAAQGEPSVVPDGPSHQQVLERGARSIERLRPRVESFWSAYREAGPPAYPELPLRATAFAGWHLLDRLLAGATRVSRLSGIARAAAGIGRAALLAPERHGSAIGLGDRS